MLRQVCRKVNVQIVRRSDAGKFVVLPRRWIVERTIAWLNRYRGLAKDWERMNRNALAVPTLGIRQADGAKALSDQAMIVDGLSGGNLLVFDDFGV